MFHAILHWLLQVSGITNESGRWYAWWSGPGSDLGEYTIAGSIISGIIHDIRAGNCSSHGCWRPGLHAYEMDGVVHHLCKKCHPALKGQHHTREEFHAHHQSKGAKHV